MEFMADNDIQEPISNPEEQQIEIESMSNLSEEIPQESAKVKRLRGWWIVVIQRIKMILS